MWVYGNKGLYSDVIELSVIACNAFNSSLGVEEGEEREKIDASRRALMSTLVMLEWREVLME